MIETLDPPAPADAMEVHCWECGEVYDTWDDAPLCPACQELERLAEAVEDREETPAGLDWAEL